MNDQLACYSFWKKTAPGKYFWTGANWEKVVSVRFEAGVNLYHHECKQTFWGDLITLFCLLTLLKAYKPPRLTLGRRH
jgi:hypothetical protein